MRILIIKISSMGDLIHTLPALSDATQINHAIQFDWVADRSFADIPKWHPAVNQVITTAHRYWKANVFSKKTWDEFIAFKRQLQLSKYDLVIDAQSSLKSALITHMAKGLRCGLDRQTVREFGAHWFYQRQYHVSRDQHPINHLRQLFATVLGYSCPETPPTFSINLDQQSTLLLPSFPKKSLLFIYNTSRKIKEWPQTHWKILINLVQEAGYTVLLPWGNTLEKKYAQQIADQQPHVIVLPKLSLTQLALILKKVQGTVGGDTGLSHLAAAVGTPSVTLYGPTDGYRIGAIGPKQLNLMANFPCAPCYRKQCNYQQSVLSSQKPACLFQLSPQLVWEKLQTLINPALEDDLEAY